MSAFVDDGDRQLKRSESASNVSAYWKHHLLLLQEAAPKPILVAAVTPVPNKPSFYGAEFHGLIDRVQSDRLLSNAGDGAFLVRRSQRAEYSYTLCIRFDGATRNYKLFYDGQHFVSEKRFSSVEQLVADGLISMHIEKHAAEYIHRMSEDTVYEESPYSQYQRHRQHRRMSPGSQVSNDSSSQACSTCDARQPAGRTVSSSSYSRRRSDGADKFKCHRFKSNTFLTPHWCDYCGNYMWGLVNQGVKCEECGFVAHRKCGEKTLPDCRPDLKYIKRTFGVDLTTFSMAHDVQVPPVVQFCIDEIERRGLHTEGLYRVSGSHEEIERLRIYFDNDCPADPVSSGWLVEDVHALTGLLKLYFRLLPIPLITYGARRELVNVFRYCQTDRDRVKLVRRLLKETLPSANYNVLRLFLLHLRRVADCSDQNRMNEENLARILVLTVMNNSVHPADGLLMPQLELCALHFMIKNAEPIFTASHQHICTAPDAGHRPGHVVPVVK